jgi:hypothetical protein
MKTLLLLLLFPFIGFTQTDVKIDTVYSTAKLRELGNRDIRFGIKQISEDILSEKYNLSDEGEPIKIEVYYFGIPKHTLRIAGIEKSNVITQVGVRLYYKGNKYEGMGESETEITAVMIEIKEGSIPFEKMTVSNALKKAIYEAVTLMP